jgi:hypothetical protein
MAILWFMLDPATSRAAVSECINLVCTSEIINSVLTKFTSQFFHVMIFIRRIDGDIFENYS